MFWCCLYVVVVCGGGGVTDRRRAREVVEAVGWRSVCGGMDGWMDVDGW